MNLHSQNTIIQKKTKKKQQQQQESCGEKAFRFGSFRALSQLLARSFIFQYVTNDHIVFPAKDAKFNLINTKNNTGCTWRANDSAGKNSKSWD